MGTPVGRSLGAALSVAVLASVATARPAVAQCPPSWKQVSDIKQDMTVHPYMVRGFAAPESTVMKAVADAFVAAGFEVLPAPRRSPVATALGAKTV